MTIQQAQQLDGIRTRTEYLGGHISRAQRAREKLVVLRQKAERMAYLADEVEVSTSVNAWRREGFTVKLWFEDGIPQEVEDVAVENFDEFQTYYGDTHMAKAHPEYNYHARASVTVRYD